jgi:putative phosphoesterase
VPLLSNKVVKIGVFADTHIYSLKEIPQPFLASLKGLDLVIHLGDFVCPELADYLKSCNNFYGIAGNHDPHTIKSMLPSQDVIEINGKRLGLMHGYWFPLFCQHRSLARFKKDKVDAILYGHTHVIRNEIVNNILFFNPGSASALWPAPWKTFGILRVGDQITGEILSISGKGKAGFAKITDSVIDRNTIIKWVCGSPRVPDCPAGF